MLDWRGKNGISNIPHLCLLGVIIKCNPGLILRGWYPPLFATAFTFFMFFKQKACFASQEPSLSLVPHPPPPHKLAHVA